MYDPDGTVNTINEESVSAYDLTGTQLWESAITFKARTGCAFTYKFDEALHFSNGVLNLLYDHECTSLFQSRRGYSIIQFNTLGQEIGRIERDFPVKESVVQIPFFSVVLCRSSYRNGIVDADMQIDALDNLLVMEQFGKVGIMYMLVEEPERTSN